MLESATTSPRCADDQRRLQNVGLGLLVFLLLSGWPQAWQRPQSSQERAQDQPFPAGSPFALLPKAQIATRTNEKKSIMPDNLADKVGDAAVRDVTAYLLEGPGK